MSNEAVVAVFIRLFGIWILVDTLGHKIFSIIALLQAGSPFYWPYLLVAIFWLALAILMIWMPMNFAQRLLPEDHRADEATSWTLDQFQSVLFAALGMFFILIAVTNTSHWLIAWDTIRKITSSDVQVNPVQWAQILGVSAQITAGVWLLLGAKGLSGILRWARNAGSN